MVLELDQLGHKLEAGHLVRLEEHRQQEVARRLQVGARLGAVEGPGGDAYPDGWWDGRQ